MRYLIFATVFVTLVLSAVAGCAHEHAISTIDHPEGAIVRIHVATTAATRPAEVVGFLVSAKGLIVTCGHLVQDGSPITVMLSDGRSLSGRFVQEDPEGDVALISVVGEKLPFFLLHDDNFGPGVHVRAIGRAGIADGEFDHFENFGKDIDFTASTPVECGAPLLADNGQVVGMVRGPRPDHPGEQLATPEWHILKMIPQPNAPSP